MGVVALFAYVFLIVVIATATNRLFHATLGKEVVLGGWIIGGLFTYLLHEYRTGDGGTVGSQFALVLMAFLILLVFAVLVGGTMF